MADSTKLTREERFVLAEKYETNGYVWEFCVLCGKSDKDCFIENGWSMYIWHVDIGALCEDCYFDYPDQDDDNDGDVAKLENAPGSKPDAERLEGSTPSVATHCSESTLG